MENLNSPSSVAAPHAASNYDEVHLQQSITFSESLKDLKNLRKQLYSAAEYFELSYGKDEKNMMVDNLKDYVTKVLINTVDHLGSVAYKINCFLDGKVHEISKTELHVSCLEKRLETCQKFIDNEGLSQHSLMIRTPRYKKRYIFSVGEASKDTPLSSVGLENSILRTLHQSSRPSMFEFTKILSNNELEKKIVSVSPREKRGVSPLRSQLIRSGSLTNSMTTPKSTNAITRYPSAPWRSLSVHSQAGKIRQKEIEQHSSKSIRLLKALLSMRKSKKNANLNKYLDDI